MTGDAPGSREAEAREQVRAAFPEVDRIEDDDLRAGVVDAWAMAMAKTDVADLASVPWFPPDQERLDLPDERLVPHVREVVAGAVALAESLAERRGDRLDLSTDVLIAGALVHDVSKLYEYRGAAATGVGRLLGHPHYGIHVVAAAGLPVEVQHVVLAHTPRTAVEPATLEAEVVRRADEVAAAAIRLRSLSDLRDA